MSASEIPSDQETIREAIRGVHTRHKQRERSRDMVESLEQRVDKADLTRATMTEQLAETKGQLVAMEDGLEEFRDELCEEMQATVKALEKRNAELEAQVENLGKKLDELMREFKK